MHTQKLQQLQASSEEERRKLEAQYKERLKNYDEKLRDVRRKEREFINMQKLKMRTEVRMCVNSCEETMMWRKEHEFINMQKLKMRTELRMCVNSCEETMMCDARSGSSSTCRSSRCAQR